MQNRHMIAGAAARTLAQCLVHPIDTVKTRLQVSSRMSRPWLLHTSAGPDAYQMSHIALLTLCSHLVSQPAEPATCAADT